MVFIVFMIFRVGGPSEASHVFGWGNDMDTSIFGIMTSVGYFYIIIILLIGIAMGDNNKFTVKCQCLCTLACLIYITELDFQLLLFNFFGFLFFIAIGAEQIRVWGKYPWNQSDRQVEVTRVSSTFYYYFCRVLLMEWEPWPSWLVLFSLLIQSSQFWISVIVNENTVLILLWIEGNWSAFNKDILQSSCSTHCASFLDESSSS